MTASLSTRDKQWISMLEWMNAHPDEPVPERYVVGEEKWSGAFFRRQVSGWLSSVLVSLSLVVCFSLATPRDPNERRRFSRKGGRHRLR